MIILHKFPVQISVWYSTTLCAINLKNQNVYMKYFHKALFELYYEKAIFYKWYFSNLLSPAGLFDLNRDGDSSVALYCRRVLIMNKAGNVLPKWLRFMKGTVQPFSKEFKKLLHPTIFSISLKDRYK